ncbi:MAG: hypothetical protein A4E19_17240 [Nitrospira sp. SG-bin1]|nr:MAG: hypothetical protein A4E19_17240 [Nitrospira sp. SG-bin1]
MRTAIADRVSLSGLIEGFSHYAKTVREILQHPFKFPESLDMDRDDTYQNALSFIVYSTALVFFLLIPIFSKYEMEVSKITFLMRYLCLFAMYATLSHVGLRFIARSKSSIRSTAVVYAYLFGITLPLNTLLLYPVYFSFGPAALFGLPEDYVRLASFYEEHVYLNLYVNVVCNLLFGIFMTLVTLSWFSKTHHVGKARVFLSLFLTGSIGGVIQILVLHEVFGVTFELVEQWLKYA